MYWQPAAARGEASKSLMLLLCDRNGMTKPRKYGKHRVQVGRAVLCTPLRGDDGAYGVTRPTALARFTSHSRSAAPRGSSSRVQARFRLPPGRRAIVRYA